MSALFLGLVPFWAWILLGMFLGWRLTRFYDKKFGFMKKIRNPFSRKSDSSGDDKDDDRSTFDKGLDLLSKPAKWLTGDFLGTKDDKKRKKKKKDDKEGK